MNALKSIIISGLFTIATTSLTIACTSDDDQLLYDDESVNLENVDLLDLEKSEVSTDIINKVTICFRGLTPIVNPDTIPSFEVFSNPTSNVTTVRLDISPKSNGLYLVHFAYKNLDIRYRTANLAEFPNAPDAIDMDVSINKNASNLIERPYIKVDGKAPHQQLNVSVKIHTDDGGSLGIYNIGFQAILNGNNVIIFDDCKVIK